MEVQEIRQIFTAKGFKGLLLEQVVGVITSNKDVWVDTMMKEELGMVNGDKAPFKTAGITFLSFVVIGTIPLLFYVMVGNDFSVNDPSLFLYSCILTGVALAVVGGLKSLVTEKMFLLV